MALIHELETLLTGRFTALLLPGSAGPAARHGADQTVDGFRELLALQWPNLAVPALGLPGARRADRRRRRGRPAAGRAAARRAATARDGCWRSDSRSRTRPAMLTPVEPRTT